MQRHRSTTLLGVFEEQQEPVRLQDHGHIRNKGEDAFSPRKLKGKCWAHSGCEIIV